jgi:colanic acid biosynthesis glycosyl transferase WcaI
MRPSPHKADTFKNSHNIRGFLLIYSGNIGITHPLEILIHALEMLTQSSHSEDIKALIIGKGSKRVQLEHLVKALQIPETVRFLDPVPYQDLPAVLSAANLAVVALDSPSSDCSLPSKTFNCLACGTPILALARKNSALSSLVLSHNCGFVIEPSPNAPLELVSLLRHILQNPLVLHELSLNALSAASLFTPTNADLLADTWLGSSSFTVL